MSRFTSIIKQPLNHPMDFQSAKQIVDAAIESCEEDEQRPCDTYYPYRLLRVTFVPSRDNYRLFDEICISGERTLSRTVASVDPGTDTLVGLIRSVTTYDECVVNKAVWKLQEAVQQQCTSLSR